MAKIAGRLGWTEREFHCSTPRYLFLAWKGRLEMDMDAERSAWMRARMVAYYAVAPHSKGIKSQYDVVKFDWEKPKNQTINLPVDVAERLHSEMDAIAAKLWAQKKDEQWQA